MALLPPFTPKPEEKASEEKIDARTGRPAERAAGGTLNTSSPSQGLGRSSGHGDSSGAFPASPRTDRTRSGLGDHEARNRPQQEGGVSDGFQSRYSRPAGAGSAYARSSSSGVGSSVASGTDPDTGLISAKPLSASRLPSGGSQPGGHRTGEASLSGTFARRYGDSAPASSTGISSGSSSETALGRLRASLEESRAGGASAGAGATGAGSSRGGSLGTAAPRTGSFASRRDTEAGGRDSFSRFSRTGAGGTADRGFIGSRDGDVSSTARSSLTTSPSVAGSTTRPSSMAARGSSTQGNERLAAASRSAARPSLGAARPALGPTRGGEGITDEEFSLLQEFIYTQSGIFIADTRKYLIENRLSNRLRELNLKSFNEYYYYLRFDKNKAEELQQLFNVITTNETSFYRNPPQLKVFQEVVVPRELEKIRASGQRKLRIWSAGCSTGEEPYTLAIILKEALIKSPL